MLILFHSPKTYRFRLVFSQTSLVGRGRSVQPTRKIVEYTTCSLVDEFISDDCFKNKIIDKLLQIQLLKGPLDQNTSNCMFEPLNQ